MRNLLRSLTLLPLLLFLSCSQVNVESRQHYDKLKGVPHGIVATPAEGDDRDPRMPVDMKAAQRGQKIYENNCLGCHGKAGEGDGPMLPEDYPQPKDLKQVVRQFPNFKFYLSATQWTGEMPGWKTTRLTDKELYDVAQYLRKLARTDGN